MTITELQQQYAAHPNTAVMERLLKDASVQTIFCGGLCASSASLFSSVLVKQDVYMERVGRKRLYYCSYSCFKLRLYLKK